MLIILKILRAPPFDFRGIFTRLQFSKLNTYLDFVIFRYPSGFCQISIPIWILSNLNTHLDFVKSQYLSGFCQSPIPIWILSNLNTYLDFVKVQYPSGFCQISIPIWILSNLNTHLDFVKVQYSSGFCQNGVPIVFWLFYPTLSRFSASNFKYFLSVSPLSAFKWQ